MPTMRTDIRKSIFKRELAYYFEINNIDEHLQHAVINKVFLNPIDTASQYLLKESICNAQILEEQLKEVISDTQLLSDIKLIFTITEDLELPEDLRLLISKKQEIAVFVGAGASKLIGIPLWTELSNFAIDYLYKKGMLSFYESQKIKVDIIDPKQKMTIFDEFLKENKAGIDEFYEEHMNPKDKTGSINPYDLLVDFDCIKLSTNIDHEFFYATERNMAVQQINNGEQPVATAEIIKVPKLVYRDFDKVDTVKQLRKEAVYQIHGSYKHLSEGAVITTRDYLERYYKNPELGNFLKKIFNHYTVIFIGYGLEEFEVLEHCVKGTGRHYALIGTYINEPNLFRIKQKYFDAIGITAVSYYLDFNGYNRLLLVLENWSKKIKAEKSNSFYQKISEIDEVI